MVTEDDIRRAQLTVAVQAELTHLAREMDDLLRGLALTNNRLSGIVASLAWHQRRQTPELRLQELAQELRRLQANVAEETAEYQFYRFLLTRLSLEQMPDQLEKRLLRHLSEHDRPHWTQEARLRFAQAGLQVVELLVRGETVRQEVEAQGGAIRW